MSVSTATAPSKSTPTKPRKDRERKEKHTVASDRLKTVVRRLPPNLPEDIFWGSVTAWVTDETISWKTYWPGKLKKRLHKENIPSRAYIAFKNEEQLASFGKEFDGHIFRDKEGNDYQAVVEFAPYQKIPPEKKKADARNATIEQDEDYISFLESLKAPANAEHPSMETLLAASQPPPPPKTTPLLEALKAEKSANKDKEAILRNHAHYKDSSVLASIPRKESEHGKKKAQKVAEPVISKKAAKKLALAQAEAAQKVVAAAVGGPNPSKNPNPNQPAGSSSTVTTPKPPKPARGPKVPPQAQTKPPRPAVASIITPSPSSAPGLATQSTSASDISPSEPAAAAATIAKDSAALSRRSRPVIGLASRQFEAALSGAGVSPTVAVGGRSRREREKEREVQQPNDIGVSSSSNAVTTSQPPPSPRSARQNKASSARPGVLPANVPGLLQPPAVSSSQPLHGSERGSGRGMRRGRGRGRGAQGPPRGG